jgi:membrane-bound acyltransferase YfiQ involved in biofilm formation
MKTLVYISLLFISLLSLPALAQEQQVVVPYTLADRDRAILTEAKISALEARMELNFKSIDKQFMYQQKQIDDIKTLFYWGFGILITLFIFMLGYMIWDRRTAMRPALEQASRAEESSRTLIAMLREYAKKHPDLAEILRTHGIL